MSGLVERLMDANTEELHGWKAIELGQLLGEAADKITRLEEELAAERGLILAAQEAEGAIERHLAWSNHSTLPMSGALLDARKHLTAELHKVLDGEP